MLGISRNSVREALRVLHGLGYVEKAAGRRVIVTAASQAGKGIFDESVMIEAAPVANEVRSHIAQRCAELAAERLTLAELAALERALAALEDGIAREDMAAAKSAHDSFYGLFLAGARNPLLVAMFNQAQVARLSNVSPDHRSFYDPRHLAHHRALLRALRKRDKRAARAVVRRHFQSLGLMLDVATSAEPARAGTPCAASVGRSDGGDHAAGPGAAALTRPAAVIRSLPRPRPQWPWPGAPAPIGATLYSIATVPALAKVSVPCTVWPAA